MNEVKISTKVNENNKGQLSIKLNVAAMGFKLNYRKNRFNGPLAEVKSVSAAARFTTNKNNELEIFLPREVFAV